MDEEKHLAARWRKTTDGKWNFVIELKGPKPDLWILGSFDSPLNIEISDLRNALASLRLMDRDYWWRWWALRAPDYPLPKPERRKKDMTTGYEFRIGDDGKVVAFTSPLGFVSNVPRVSGTPAEVADWVKEQLIKAVDKKLEELADESELKCIDEQIEALEVQRRALVE